MRGLARFSKEGTAFTYILIPYGNPKSLMPSASVCGK
jgi:hypothetical protein